MRKAELLLARVPGSVRVLQNCTGKFWDTDGNSLCEKFVKVRLGRVFEDPVSSIIIKAGTGILAEKIYFPYASVLRFFMHQCYVIIIFNCS
jgi:hypothetical protein